MLTAQPRLGPRPTRWMREVTNLVVWCPSGVLWIGLCVYVCIHSVADCLNARADDCVRPLIYSYRTANPRVTATIRWCQCPDNAEVISFRLVVDRRLLA